MLLFNLIIFSAYHESSHLTDFVEIYLQFVLVYLFNQKYLKTLKL